MQRKILCIVVVLFSSAALHAAGSFSLLPEIGDDGIHVGYTITRHYSFLIPNRESRFFAGAVFSPPSETDPTHIAPGLGILLIQNLAGDRISGRYQLDLHTRLDALYRIPTLTAGVIDPVADGFFVESAPYPVTVATAGLRFLTADRYRFPAYAAGVRLGVSGEIGYGADEPYSAASTNAFVGFLVPLFRPFVELSARATYRGYVPLGAFGGAVPLSALPTVRLRGYAGRESYRHAATGALDLIGRVPFEFYVPMGVGLGVYVDAGRGADTPGGLIAPVAASEVVAGAYLEYRVIAPYETGSVSIRSGFGFLPGTRDVAGPWVRIEYTAGWFFSDPL
ncbi:MAG: hypothetical protein EA426_17830 [Spirochaetaceae bacterium]|nr:MAG: hypothetical protein EA426_17830 [Spirochaetaceae bacterium]